MRNLMDRGLMMLGRMAGKVAGGQTIYQQGDAHVVAEATFGRWEGLLNVDHATMTEYSERDFIYEAQDLAFGGKTWTPCKGDLITVAADKQIFEVLPIADGKVFHNCDPQGRRIRVHTKRIA